MTYPKCNARRHKAFLASRRGGWGESPHVSPITRNVPGLRGTKSLARGSALSAGGWTLAGVSRRVLGRGAARGTRSNPFKGWPARPEKQNPAVID